MSSTRANALNSLAVGVAVPVHTEKQNQRNKPAPMGKIQAGNQGTHVRQCVAREAPVAVRSGRRSNLDIRNVSSSEGHFCGSGVLELPLRSLAAARAAH